MPDCKQDIYFAYTMVSQADTSEWYALTEDSETDEDWNPATDEYDSSSKNISRKHRDPTDASLSQCSLQHSWTSLTVSDSRHHTQLSQYSLADSRTSQDGSRMDKPAGNRVEVERLNLQFENLVADDSQEGDSTQLSSSSDQQEGTSTDDPWRSTTETSDGPSMSELPLERHKAGAEDTEQTATEDDSSVCEEFLNTAISEVSKDFISGHTLYPLQPGDSDLSSDDQKVMHKSLEGKYTETIVSMSDSDWCVTESDTNSPPGDRGKGDYSTNSVTSFSPPLSSTVLTHSSGSAKPVHGLSMIQEVSAENTASFREIPTDRSSVSSVNYSRGSFLGRDHERHLDLMNTRPGLSSDGSKFSRNVGDRGDDSGYKELDKESCRGSAFSASTSHTTERTSDVTRSSGQSIGSTRSENTTSARDEVLLRLNNIPSTFDLKRRSEMILDKTLSNLNLKPSYEGRSSFPLASSSCTDEDKRHSLSLLGTELSKTTSRSAQSYHGEDFTKSTKSVGSDSSRSTGSNIEVASLMARSGSSVETTVPGGDILLESRAEMSRNQKQLESEILDMDSRVDRILAETASVGQYAFHNRNRNCHVDSDDMLSRDSPPPLPPPPPPPSASSHPSLPHQPLPPPPEHLPESRHSEQGPASLDYMRLQRDLQEIQNSLHKNLDFGDSGNESVPSSDAERDRLDRTPVGSETGSEIVPSTTTTPDRADRSHRLLWDYGADIAQPGRFTTHDTDATDTDTSEGRRGPGINRAEVAENAAKRHMYNSDGEETLTSTSSTKMEAGRAVGTDDEQQRSETSTPTGRNVDQILENFRAQRSMLESNYLHSMSGQVPGILHRAHPDPEDEKDMLHRLARSPARSPQSHYSFSDSSPNTSSRSLVVSESDVRRKLEMSGLSSPDRSRTLGLSSFTEYATPKKVTNPFLASCSAKNFLYQQLDDMSNKTFNHSIELRTPLRPIIDCYPMYRYTQSPPGQEPTETGQNQTNNSNTGIPDRGQPEGVSPEGSDPQRSQSLVQSTSTESTQSNTDRREASTSRTAAGVEGGLAERRSPDSQTMRDLDLGAGQQQLRPYRPAGSRDMYYTESDTGSVADSITTLESTHTGSDDAIAPYFPHHVLGSRTDLHTETHTDLRTDLPSDPIPRKSQSMHLELALSTIEEKSVTDDKDRPPADKNEEEFRVRGAGAGAARTSDGQMDLRDGWTSGYASTQAVHGEGSGSNGEMRSQREPEASKSRDSDVHSSEIRRFVDSGFSATDVRLEDNGSQLHEIQRREDQAALRDMRQGIEGERFSSRERSPQEGYDRQRDLEVVGARQGQTEDRSTEGRMKSVDTEEYWSNGDNRRAADYTAVYRSKEAMLAREETLRAARRVLEESDTREMERKRESMSRESVQPSHTLAGQNLDSGIVLSIVRSTDQYQSRRDEEPGPSVDTRTASGPGMEEQRDLSPRNMPRRLRSRPSGDFLEQREQSPPLPDPEASPIQHHSMLRESQRPSDPRHSTVVDSPMDALNGGSPERQEQRESVPRDDNENGQMRMGKDGRPRSSDRKDSRQRMEQNRIARRSHPDVSSSEDDTNKAIDRAPVSRSVQLLRETLEQEVDRSVPADINALWQRFQELNPTDSDTSLNLSRMETLADLLRNPSRHLLASYFHDKESQRHNQDQRVSEEREKRRIERRSETESNASFEEVAQGKNRSGQNNPSRTTSKKNVKDQSQDSTDNLYSIPEDVSFDKRRHKKARSLIDPNMEKLRGKIERQRDKIEHERRKDLKRMEKLVKLEQLLSAKKKGKISESTLMEQLECISTTSVPTDTTEEYTESTLTVSGVSGVSGDTLTDDSTTAKDSSIEMQLAKYSRQMEPKSCKQQAWTISAPTRDPTLSTRKEEKLRVNEKVKERTRKDDKNMRRSKGKPGKEDEALYDYRDVNIQIVDSNRRHRPTSRERLRDVATNYPSPDSRSPHRKQDENRRTRSEGIQTSPGFSLRSVNFRSPSPTSRHHKSRSQSPGHRGRVKDRDAPFSLQEKDRQSRSPPYSSQFTPEASRRHKPQQPRKLPAKPKGIAWFVEVKDARPWRAPLKEREAYAARQMAQWQTAEPGDIMDGENCAPPVVRPMDDNKEVDTPKENLMGGEYSTAKMECLQDVFNVKMQHFISQSRERQKRIALAAQHRHMQETLRREREMLFTDKRKHAANPNAHPLSENLICPRKRVFSRKEQKNLTQKTYRRLPEVVLREAERKKQAQYKLFRLRSRVYTKRLQRQVLMKAGAY